ncbi:uncharacterized protein LOC106475267 isoform X2 [Limulus polyphemus]|uniref:Uncharacterized protein LOC106475267 isoform X2 n=1 Tax=Limulus polyphemus TaxID=6850 RepID=A0ABM1RUS8_LIMPO|nr:uncharacterized protein LOC106475267 isoform X2 [Limulus polyphemus]
MDKYHSKQDDASIFDFEDLIPKKRCRKITVIESDDDDDSVHLKSSTNQNGQNLTSVSTGKITQETLFLRGEGIKEKELLYVDLPYKQDDNSDSEDFRSVKKGRMAMVIRDDDDDMIEVKDSKNQESDTTSIHSEENLCVQDKCKKIVEKLDYNSDLDFAPKKKRKIVIAPSSENTSSESSEEEKIKRNSIKKSNFSRENSIIRGEMDSCEDSKGSSDKEDEDSDSSFIDDSTDESCDVSKMLKEAIYHVGRSGYDLEPVSYSSPRKTRKDDEDKNVSQLEKECNSRRYPHKLLATLKELSSNDVKIPHEILKEWEFYKTEIDEEMLSECSCGKKNIKELNFMKNKKTSSVCIIGSECIHWFDELNLNGIMKLGQMLLRKGVLVNFRHHQKDKLLFRVDSKELSLQHTFHLLRKPMLREYYSVPFHYNKCAESWFFNVYSDNMTKLKINKEYHIFIKMVAEVLGRKEVHINEKDSSSESDEEEATVKEIDNWEEKSISKKDEKIVFYLRKVELPKAKEPVVSKPSIKQFFKI